MPHRKQEPTSTQVSPTAEDGSVAPEVQVSEVAARSDTERPPPVGKDVMVDHFRVMRLVGSGGMGEVYQARDTELGRKVTVARCWSLPAARSSFSTQPENRGAST